MIPVWRVAVPFRVHSFRRVFPCRTGLVSKRRANQEALTYLRRKAARTSEPKHAIQTNYSNAIHEVIERLYDLTQ